MPETHSGDSPHAEGHPGITGMLGDFGEIPNSYFEFLLLMKKKRKQYFLNSNRILGGVPRRRQGGAIIFQMEGVSRLLKQCRLFLA